MQMNPTWTTRATRGQQNSREKKNHGKFQKEEGIWEWPGKALIGWGGVGGGASASDTSGGTIPEMPEPSVVTWGGVISWCPPKGHPGTSGEVWDPGIPKFPKFLSPSPTTTKNLGRWESSGSRPNVGVFWDPKLREGEHLEVGMVETMES